MHTDQQLPDHLKAWVNTPRNAIRALLLGIESLETWHAVPCPTDDDDERLAALAALEHSLGIDSEEGYSTFAEYLVELWDRVEILIDQSLGDSLLATEADRREILTRKLERLGDEVERLRKIRNIEDRLDALEEEAKSA